MNNKTFDTLKWIALIVIPALGTLVGTVGQATGWDGTKMAVTIIAALGVFLGAVLGVSNANYKGENDEK